MAIIGSINVLMMADASNFTKGIFGATKAMAAFERAAHKNIGKGLGSISAGFGDIAGVKPGLYFGGMLKSITSPIAAIAAKLTAPIGAAFNALDLTPFIGGLGKVASGITQIGYGFAKLGISAVANAFSSLVGFVVDLAKKAVVLGLALGGLAAYGLWEVAKSAIAIGEQTDRARIVFGPFAQTVIDQSKLMAKAFGVSRTEFITSASAFGTIFEGVGYVKKDAADLSVHFTKLATDLSSLVHIPVGEAMEKIQSGLAGQIRPLREVGVFMSDEAIKAKAAALEIAELNTELTESQKVQARIAFITESLAIAHNNLADTAKSAGNQVRSLSGRFEGLKTEVGTSLLGVLVPALEEVNLGIHALRMAWEASSFAATEASVGVLGGSDKQVQAIGFVQRGVMTIADAWQSVKIAALEASLAITKAIATLKAWADVNAPTSPAAFALAKSIGAIGSVESLSKSAAEQTRQLALAKEQPKASKGVAAAFDAARADIAKARDELAKQKPLDVSKLKPGVDLTKQGIFSNQEQQTWATALSGSLGDIAGGIKPKKAVSEFKYASAAAAGSAEAANAVLRSKYGMGQAQPDTGVKATAKNTATANTHLAKISSGIDKLILYGNLQPYEFVGDLG